MSPGAGVVPGYPGPQDGGAGRLLTVRQVAERLALSTATIYKLCDRGDLAHVRISNAIRFHPEALAAYLARKK